MNNCTYHGQRHFPHTNSCPLLHKAHLTGSKMCVGTLYVCFIQMFVLDLPRQVMRSPRVVTILRCVSSVIHQAYNLILLSLLMQMIQLVCFCLIFINIYFTSCLFAVIPLFENSHMLTFSVNTENRTDTKCFNASDVFAEQRR